MFTEGKNNMISFFKGKIYKLKIFLVLVALSFVTGAHGNPIIENDLEDLNVIISQFVGGQPNVLTILDLSGSMGRNHGGSQIGNWDNSDAFFRCETDAGTGTTNGRILASHCAEEMAGTAVCGTASCGQDGRCDDQSEFDAQVLCVQTEAPALIMAPIFTTICGGPLPTDCGTPTDATERINAAAAIEAAGGLTQCSGPTNCQLSGDNNPACNTTSDYNRFRTCMQTSQSISANKQTACTGGTPDCEGQPRFGSSRLDIALDVFFSFLDSDNSLATKTCTDSSTLFDGTSTSINCQDYMETPFRDVSTIVRGTTNLPTTPAAALMNELTNNDADSLGVRIRPMTYSGVGRWAGCTASNTFGLATTGSQSRFAGATGAELQEVWRFYRATQGTGGTPLAYSLGFSDTNSGINSSTSVGRSALFAYKPGLQTDPAISCRPEFVVVITDGEDTCSGECGLTPNSCNGNVTTNANRRSSIQAVSNLRTFYARNTGDSQGVKKEILTFVIGIGINEPEGVRTLNAMALAGGTHTTGVIEHTDPNGTTVGTVKIDDVLPSGSAFDPYKALGITEGINSDPSDATLRDCLVPVEDAGNTAPNTGIHCHIGDGDQSLFYNAFFNTGDPFVAAEPLEDFAFFANNAEQLAAALETILSFVETFSSTGVAPAAPQSSASVALRDRIFLSIFTPITTSQLWQGRLALYGFVDDPDNFGSRLVVNNNIGLTPEERVIFNPDGTINTEKAQDFYWEAGKVLAEIDISTRRLFTIDPDSSVTDPNGQIRYLGDMVDFDENLDPDVFGITDLDVVDPIPDFCTAEPPDGIDDCSSQCTVITSATCRDCVKGCIRGKIVDFMRGNTGINTIGDPLGGPTTGGFEEGSIGFDCPDPETSTGSLATCSVRLGAILNSPPRLVGSPSPLFFDIGFQNFGVKFRDRSAAVYVGANDGFQHAFHAGELVKNNLPEANPFTNEDELIPFFDEGTGAELFGFAPPSFLPASLDPNTLPVDIPSGFGPPDFRFGDFKSFVLSSLQPARSFVDGAALVADVFIDGDSNGIQNDAAICTSDPVDPADGEIDLCGKEWHTVLVTGPRNGGGAYTALDVTNPNCAVGPDANGVDTCTSVTKHINNADAPEYPEHMWTTFDTHFGNAWSDPTLGRVRMRAEDAGGNEIIVDRWVMFVGGGLDPTDIDPLNGIAFGNAFYAVDIATGKIIYKFHPSTSGVANVDKMVCDLPAKVGAFDINSDGYIDLVYEGDTCGRLWRFDVSMPIETTASLDQTGPDGNATFSAPDWTGDIAFCATSDLNKCLNPSTIQPEERQPIFFAPTIVLDDLGQRHVIFTTGNRRFPSNTSELGKLYNFIDGFIPAFLAGGAAVTVTTKTEANFTSGQIIDLVSQSGVEGQFTTQGGSTVNNQGEFIVRFPDNIGSSNGEKGFGTPVVINRVLIFATFAPSPELLTDPCGPDTGFGRVFALDYLSGEPALARIPGAENLLTGQSASEKKRAVGRTVAKGLPTPAQLTFGGRGSVVLTLAFSGGPASLGGGGGAQFIVWELPPFPTRTQTLFWEEIL